MVKISNAEINETCLFIASLIAIKKYKPISMPPPLPALKNSSTKYISLKLRTKMVRQIPTSEYKQLF
jgi:hypothetical protein